MNTVQLDDCLRGNINTRKIYKGTYPCDQIPKRKIAGNRGEFYCVNLEESWKPGNHWVGIYITGKTIEIFDTGGRSLINHKYLRELLKFHNDKQYNYNSRQIQSYTSDLCGEFVCLYCLSKVKNLSLSNFINIFNFLNLNRNDCLVLRLFKKYFKCSRVSNYRYRKCIQYCNKLGKCN
jgi:hypothetical protein